MSYVDGFVLVVPKKNTKAYQKMANAGGKMWKKYGAIGYFECMGDDLNPNMGGMKVLTFPKMAKVKKDPSMNEANWKDKPMPFDVKKMAYGGFKVMVKK